MTTVNPSGARFQAGAQRGHYESWFIRANHPTRPLAFWVRYTVTAPRAKPEAAVFELFAAVFDGERHAHHVAREEVPAASVSLSASLLDVDLGGARLTATHASGAASGPTSIAWNLAISNEHSPLLLFPERLYATAFPKAKSLVMAPLARFAGSITVAGVPFEVEDWVGSTNHNWGSQHTDRYAWGQVAGFAEAPDTFLEVASARLGVAGLLLPTLTPLVLRHRGATHALNALPCLLRRATLPGLLDGASRRGATTATWSFHARGRGIAVAGTIQAQSRDFVTFWYANPPEGRKLCVNTKIADATLEITTANGTERLSAPRRAAFELLADHGSGLDALPDPV